jgi:hypothetical protein
MRLFLHLKLPKVITVLLLLFTVSYSYAQTGASNAKKDTDNYDVRSASFFLPQALPAGKYSQNVSVLYIVVPKDWTTEAITAPMLMYSGKYTLPLGFNLQASLATLFISYRLNFGPFYTYTSGNYHFGFGYQVAYSYGLLHHFGFNTTVNVWEQQPSASFGYSFKKAALVLRTDLYYTNSLHENQAGYTISYPSFSNGYSVSATLERRLWKNRLLSIGTKFSFIKYHILAWPAFPVNPYQYWVPEVDLGLSF